MYAYIDRKLCLKVITLTELLHHANDLGKRSTDTMTCLTGI